MSPRFFYLALSILSQLIVDEAESLRNMHFEETCKCKPMTIRSLEYFVDDGMVLPRLHIRKRSENNYPGPGSI